MVGLSTRDSVALPFVIRALLSNLWFMNVRIGGRKKHFRTVTFDTDRNAVMLIEQRLLPHDFQIVAANDYRQTAEVIEPL